MNAESVSDLPPPSSPRRNNDPQSVYHHLREAYRSLEAAREIAARHSDEWPSLERQAQRAMRLAECGMGTLELFFLCNAKERP